MDKAFKDELLKIIEEEGQQSAPTAPEVFHDLKPSKKVAINDSDQNFIKANQIIKLHSDLIGKDFYLCSTQKLKAECRANDPDTVGYLPHEISYLAGLKSDEVEKLHYARKLFGGEFIQRNKIEDSIFAKQEDEKIRNVGIYNPRLLNNLGP